MVKLHDSPATINEHPFYSHRIVYSVQYTQAVVCSGPDNTHHLVNSTQHWTENMDNLKLFDVDERIQLKKFIEAKGLKFEKGSGFYQLTKKETIQDYKCVIARRKEDGQLVSGDELRTVLKIPKNSPTKVSVDQEDIPDFEIFVQSSSYNRVLMPRTKILYKLSETEIKKETLPTKKRITSKETAIEKDASPPPAKKKKATDVSGEKKKVEVVFSFDTTGSMYACLAEVRRGIKEAIRRLKREVPGIRHVVKTLLQVNNDILQ